MTPSGLNGSAAAQSTTIFTGSLASFVVTLEEAATGAMLDAGAGGRADLRTLRDGLEPSTADSIIVLGVRMIDDALDSMVCRWSLRISSNSTLSWPSSFASFNTAKPYFSVASSEPYGLAIRVSATL